MLRYLSKGFLLLIFGVVICCVIYPLALWVVGQTFFPFQSNGSMLKGPDGKYVGSKLIAQPFTKDGYFWPRPSAASYDATASTSSALAASNYALRDRVARSLGPVVKYKSGPKAGQLVAPDIENWFKADKFQGKAGIVAQWADLHNSIAQAWVKTDTAHGDYVESWAKANPGIVAKWIKENPATPKPQAADLAVVFFEDFSVKDPGKFFSAETKTGPDGKPVTTIEPVDSVPIFNRPFSTCGARTIRMSAFMMCPVIMSQLRVRVSILISHLKMPNSNCQGLCPRVPKTRTATPPESGKTSSRSCGKTRPHPLMGLPARSL